MTIFNDGWEFRLEGRGDWQPIRLPHDWLIADAKNLYADGVGHYRKFFTPSPAAHTFLRFDGVYQDSTLYVNGHPAGDWKNGYTAFTHEITQFLTPGENEIRLTVNHQSPNSRWYSGAGIYRDVHLIQKSAAHFKHDGIYISTRREHSNIWQIKIDAEVTSDKPYIVRHELRPWGRCPQSPARGQAPLTPFICEGSAITVTNPQVWDTQQPHLYELTSHLIINNETHDTTTTRFGFRETTFTPGAFYLNGNKTQLNGVCHHHDLGGLGAAVNTGAIRRQLTILRGMGVNAIRTAHNPPASNFMRLCDEMGFLVMSEFSDVWRLPKTKFDYARFFDDWAVRDVAAWVRRDRNCPSLVMWSIGNEIHDTHADATGGAKTMRFLMEETRRHDPRANAEITFCSNYLPWENTQKCADIIKNVGYNYADNLYAAHRAEHPDWFIYGGETASIVQSRGIYHFPFTKSILSDDDLQCSALGNSPTSWGAKSVEALIAAHADTPGQFIWTGFDYIGEPTPYHTKNSYFGQVDTAGFPKDAYYTYAAAWRESTVLHLYPHWDWSPGQPIDVRVATNAPRTELFINGKSVGIGTNFVVPYEPGTLKAVAYDKSGEIIATAEQKSFRDAESLHLTQTAYDDLTFAEIRAADCDGNFVANASNRIKIHVTGGELLALDNGDSTDYEQYQGTATRRLFAGKLLAIATPATAKVHAEFDWADIPIRKIELTRDGYEIRAKIHPENATHSDLEWRVADAAGIDSPLARLGKTRGRKTRKTRGRFLCLPMFTEDRGTVPLSSVSSVPLSSRATIHPKGDGEIYVRCAAKNGRSHPAIISVLPVEISGLGKALLDPFSFISAGLANAGNNTATPGNERGISTSHITESIVGFTGLNFGRFGADEITIPIFALSAEPFDFEIWRGLPGDGEKIATPHYDKGSVWNTYQPITCKLAKMLRGVQTISFVFRHSVHVKGFIFTGKTYAKIPFAAHDKIYGDTFDIAGDAVENIGNNVSITFADMNFTTPAREISLTWRSRHPKNTIRLTFTNENGEESHNILALPASNNYSTMTLALETPLAGKGKLDFIFLPGSDIDLQFFQISSSIHT